MCLVISPVTHLFGFFLRSIQYLYFSLKLFSSEIKKFIVELASIFKRFYNVIIFLFLPWFCAFDIAVSVFFTVLEFSLLNYWVGIFKFILLIFLDLLYCVNIYNQMFSVYVFLLWGIYWCFLCSLILMLPVYVSYGNWKSSCYL